MTLTNSIDWLQRARAAGFAVGAFNVNTLEQAQAIVAAAQAEAAPAILQVSHRALLYLGEGDAARGLRYASAVCRAAADSVDVPIVVHLDHGSYEDVVRAAELGFTSAMFDGGDLPLAENVARTRALAALAHAAGLSFEAEIGEVPRMDAAGHAGPVELTDPAEAAAFAAATGVDALAVAVGSVHAVKRKTVELDLDRLAAIRARVAVPLVLHGSSGVTDASIRAGIAGGLCKVNTATQLNQAFTAGVRAALAAGPDLVDPRVYLERGRCMVQERVRERLRFLGSAGKADGISS